MKSLESCTALFPVVLNIPRYRPTSIVRALIIFPALILMVSLSIARTPGNLWNCWKLQTKLNTLLYRPRRPWSQKDTKKMRRRVFACLLRQDKRPKSRTSRYQPPCERSCGYRSLSAENTINDQFRSQKRDLRACFILPI